jgi:hypothetical protein
MTESQIKKTFFAFISCLIFFLDLMLFAIMQQHQIYLLFCFFIGWIIPAAYQHQTMIIPLFLLCLLSYIDTNIFGWCLVYIIPIIAFSKYLAQHLRISYIIPYILFMTSMLLKIMLDFYCHNTMISLTHAGKLFVYNMIYLQIFIMIKSYFHIEKTTE